MGCGRTLAVGVTAFILLVLTVNPASAGAVERIQDGGFDASSCTGGNCTSTVWQESDPGGIGPICHSAGVCTMKAPSTPFDGVAWARLGNFYTPGGGISGSTSVSQSVAIPATPATLSFQLRIVDDGCFTGSFKATLDGTSVFTAADTASGYVTYQLVTVNVGSFAGATRLLSFEGSAGGGLGCGVSGAFDVDRVSLDAANVPTPPPPPPPITCRTLEATIVGTAEAELLTGTPGPDVIFAGEGNDVVKAGGGDDYVCGGTGNDEVGGQGGKDRLYGEDGKDKLNGGGGKGDLCDGGPAKDKATASCEKQKKV